MRYGGLALRQNLPLRTYVGIVPRKKQEVRLGDYFDFDPLLRRFIRKELDYFQKDKIEKHLLPFLKKYCQIGRLDGFEIHLLNELPLERSLGSLTFHGVLILAILIFYHQIELNDLAKWKGKSFLELRQDQSLKFDSLFRTIWKWENFLYPSVSGSNLINIMPSSSPILFFSKGILPSQTIAGKQLKIEELDFVDKNQYWAIKFEEIVKKFSDVSWPFDFGLIYTGETRDIKDAISLIKELNAKLTGDAEECKKNLDPYLKIVDEKMFPHFYKICQNKERVWNEYIHSLVINAIQSYLSFKRMAINGFSFEAFKELTELINKEQHLFYLLNLSSSKLDNLTSDVRTIFQKMGQEDTLVGAKMSGSTRRGDIVFLVNSHHLRNKMEEIISRLKEKLGPEINLDYASWLDGYEEEGGVKVEQFWQEGIYSKFVPEESLILKEYRGDEKIQQVITYDKLKKENYTLLLDTLENKICVKGKALTSRDLPTQAATIQIITNLLESETRSMSNRLLPVFSYTKYRNEMQGKIAAPLSKLTGGKIKIILEGGLMDFVVRLDMAKDVKIGVLKKVT